MGFSPGCTLAWSGLFSKVGSQVEVAYVGWEEHHNTGDHCGKGQGVLEK